ncbi:p53-like transcription factor, partial [Karstenula rhodostoma CBS 690.94]
MLAGNIDSYLQDRSLPRADSPRFQETLHLHGLQTEDHLRIQPQIEAKIDKGFFVSGDGVWTCYRRNYFTVICSYLLQPSGSFGQLYFYNRGDDVGTPTRKAVKALSMCIRAEVAEVDGTGKSIELIQHSPKRDRGSVVSIIPVPMWPTTETTEHANKRWSLLLQDVRDPWIHGFDRIQFKQATANNGKRRAKQHYFTIVIELLCDIRENAESNPVWITVAQRRSEPVVVRGRSPSHYAKE